MNAATPAPHASPSHPPVLIELDDAFWRDQLSRAETFLGEVALTQAAFRAMAESVLEKVQQPQFHRFLRDIADDARRHETAIAEFYRLLGRASRRDLGRDPARGRSVLGSLAAKGREVLADVEGFAGGASGPWRDLRQLWMSSHGAEGAFGVVEQLGYALGHKELAELAHKLVNEKHRGTLLIQEIVLEMAAVAVLYDGPTEAHFGPRTGAADGFLPDGP